MSLQSQSASTQIGALDKTENTKSANNNDANEPSIFSLVRLKLAGKHFELTSRFGEEKATEEINQGELILAINEKLSIVNLTVKLTKANLRLWTYAFEFFDSAREKPIGDIKNLSAGQKAIVHLVFEAYGRGDIKGGVVIIDEPELHLHPQFQSLYLKVIKEVYEAQQCQFILVTHSEYLINSETITKIKRFYIDDQHFSNIISPSLSSSDKSLIRILDNTRSTHAFFSNKVVLVEGDYDRYFFRAAFEKLSPEIIHEISVLDIGGKGNYHEWRKLFEDFGLRVYIVCDFDNVFTLTFSGGTMISSTEKGRFENELKQGKLDNLDESEKQSLKRLHQDLLSDSEFINAPKRTPWKGLIDKFIGLVRVSNIEMTVKAKQEFPYIEESIQDKYFNQVYILKQGALEVYLNLDKDLSSVINFCENDLGDWLKAKNAMSEEIQFIIKDVSK
ncbi:MAG: AAA family ATPase [Chitinophagaceae bacterium]|nr:AAA family ATPase [Chitinophagaceae bacterium]